MVALAGGEQPRVLVVDDDHDCRLMLSTLVAQAGYRVDSVADGKMALTMIRSQPPDIILLDAHLPGIDGWEVCRTIKGSDGTKNMPVLMLTAFATPDTFDRTITAGADEFMTKPFRAERLLELIGKLLAEARGDAVVPAI